jgi:signal peptidase I
MEHGFFGPVFIPKKGATVSLNPENYSIYKRVISEYEGHKIVAKGNRVFIDDKPVDTYTFQQDYYWMMGDNRHNSIDSRAWGFVPHNHIIGKPVFIWMSIDGINDGIANWSLRTDRIFTTVSGKGDRVSYFWPFVIVVAGFTLFNRWRKRKKLNA